MEKVRKIVVHAAIAGLLFTMSPLPALAEGSSTEEAITSVESQNTTAGINQNLVNSDTTAVVEEESVTKETTAAVEGESVTKETTAVVEKESVTKETTAGVEKESVTEETSAPVEKDQVTRVKTTTVEKDNVAADKNSNVEVELTGITIQPETNVFAENSIDSTSLQTYTEGTSVKVYDFSEDWYVTTVNVDGTDQSGYIQKGAIELVTSTPVKYEGIAIKSETNLYTSPTRSSKVEKFYSEGSLLKFYTYTSGWYKSNVTVNGQWLTIYIHKDDIEIPTANPVKQRGFAVQNPTKMYASPSRTAQVLRTYAKDSFLTFYSFTSGWYKSFVTVNGQWRTIYIHKDDIEKPTTNPKLQKGISLKEPINMYSLPKKGAHVIRTYPSGSTLKYYTYSSQWYKSSITYNGTQHVVYIAKDDVDQITDNPELQQGIALKSPTKMYISPTLSANTLKTYGQGSILKFYSFTSNWYKSAINVAGKRKTIYIYKNDVEKASESNKVLQGLSLKSITNVYSLPSTEAQILRKYSRNTILRFYDYSENWYKSRINVNGKMIVCYIKKSDIGVQKNTEYDLTLEQALYMQENASPVSDINSVWSAATTSQIEYYLDPLNFRSNSDTYLQFLILSHPAGTNATELNNRILYGKGVLAGKGSSYIKAAQTYHINEIYLISHSFLETGNGKSALATGIKVNGVTVYNVYGVGAYDRNPDYYGAQFAYEQGWTTVEKAIIGGAKFAAENYIHAGQDTLYKMRWNPAAMDTYGYAAHQYATDIGWAIKQTTRMSQMLSTLTQFTLLYDVPVYQ